MRFLLDKKNTRKFPNSSLLDPLSGLAQMTTFRPTVWLEAVEEFRLNLLLIVCAHQKLSGPMSALSRNFTLRPNKGAAHQIARLHRL